MISRTGLRFVAAVCIGLVSSLAFGQKLWRVTLPVGAVAGGGPVTATVDLSAKVTKTPIVVNLTGSKPIVSVPASVTIPVGQSSATFPIATTAVPTDTPVTIKATLDKSVATTGLTVQAPRVMEVAFTPVTVQGGANASALIKLSSVAPTGGFEINLSTNSPYCTAPKTAVVPVGTTMVTVPVTTSPVVGITDVSLTASVKGSRVEGSIDITPAVFKVFRIAPSSVIGGGSAIGTLMLDGPAPKDGFRVKISSESPLVTAPTIVRIPAGVSMITFTITTKLVKTVTTARISAGGSGGWIELALTLQPVPPGGR